MYKLVTPHLTPTSSVLDFGCGHGNLGLEILGYCRQVTSVDIDDDKVKILNSRIQNQGLDEMRALTVNELFQTSQVFDVVLASLVFHHINASEYLFYINKLHAHTAVGGTLVLIDVCSKVDLESLLLLVKSKFEAEVTSLKNITLKSKLKTKLFVVTGRRV